MTRLSLLTAAVLLTALPSGAEPAPSPLTHSEAERLQQAGHPLFPALSLEAEARRAEARLAGRWENPELEAEAENLGADSGTFSGAELTVSLSQRIPLGSAGARRAEADIAAGAADAEARIAAAELRYALACAFTEAWRARAEADLAARSADLAARAEGFAAARSENGRSAPSEHRTAAAARLVAETERDAARARADEAEAALAACWAGEPDGRPALRPDTFPGPLLPEEHLGALLPQSPRITLAETGIRLAEAGVRRARAEARPEPTLTAGFRHDRDSGESTALVGISFPIPLCSTPADAVRPAALRVRRAAAEAAAAKTALRLELRRIAARYTAARTALLRLNGDTLPQAEAALRIAEQVYADGKSDLTALLDAQALLLDVRGRMLATESECHLALAALRNLLCTPLSAPLTHPESPEAP